MNLHDITRTYNDNLDRLLAWLRWAYTKDHTFTRDDRDIYFIGPSGRRRLLEDLRWWEDLMNNDIANDRWRP